MVHNKLKDFVIPFQTKITSLINKAEQYKSPIGLKRNPHYSRVGWRYKYVKEFMEKNNISDETTMSSYFPNGLVIELWNEEYFELRDNSDKIDKIDTFILNQIEESESLVRSVVILKNIDSGRTNYDELIKKVKNSKELIPIKTKVYKMKHTSTKKISSNSQWGGNLSADIKGGSNKTVYNVGNCLLVNGIWDYASKEDTDNIELLLIYSALCSKNADKLLKDESQLEKIKKEFKDECEEKNLLSIEKFEEGCPFDHHGNLVCCISGNEITAEHLLGDIEEDKIEACHIDAKSESNVFINDGKVQTSFRPYNIAWGFEFWNRAQKNYSIKKFKEKLSRCPRFQ
jgi:hypothetical protein